MMSVRHINRVMVRLAALLCLTVLCHIAAGAQPVMPKISTDTLNILFRNASVKIDFNFANNARVWENFEEVFLRDYSQYKPENLRLDIYSGASPEGNEAHNKWLGEHRGLAVEQLVRQRLGGRVGNIVIHNEGPRWQAFYDKIAASNEPWRDEVLAILDQPPGTNPRAQDPRETQLRKLYGGSLWRKLQSYLAPLRSGASAVLSWQPVRDTIIIVQEPAPVVLPPPVRDTIVIVQKPAPVVLPPPVRDTLVVVHRDTVWLFNTPTTVEKPLKRDTIQKELLEYPAWAIKTNLLMWCAVAPNIQLEIPLGRNNRWALELEYFVPWFIWNHNAQAHQFHNAGLEVRYYLGDRKKHRWLQGWHIGLAGAVGYYDWEWKKHDGYQGEYVNAYLNIGFQHRWGEHWAIDASIGGGAILTKYRHYKGSSTYPKDHEEDWDRHLMFQDKSNYQWFGPCHVGVQLSYMFNAWPFHFKSKKIKEKDKR